MARKPAPKSSKPAAAPAKTAPAQMAEQPIAESPVRKTVMPKATPAGAVVAPVAKKAPAPVSYERIAERAYYISQSGNGGSEHDNWLRAENELKAELA